MTLENIALFQAMGAKMSYLSTRQGILAQNIANSDTPEYRPRDLTEVDFGAVLQEITGSEKIRMQRTAAGHLGPGSNLNSPDERKSRITYEVAPGENAVIIEEQMFKASETSLEYGLITNLIRKNVGMIRTALGRNGQ